MHEIHKPEYCVTMARHIHKDLLSVVHFHEDPEVSMKALESTAVTQVYLNWWNKLLAEVHKDGG